MADRYLNYRIFSYLVYKKTREFEKELLEVKIASREIQEGASLEN